MNTCPAGKVSNRRISPVAAHSGHRLISEPTADTLPCRREPAFMSQDGPLPLSSEGPLPQATAPDEGRLDDPAARVRDRATVIQKRTGRPVQFEITEQTRAAIGDWADGARHSA